MFEGRINEACVRMSMVTGRSAGPRAARGKKKHGSRLPNFYADARESSMRIPVEEQLCLEIRLRLTSRALYKRVIIARVTNYSYQHGFAVMTVITVIRWPQHLALERKFL